MTRFVLAGCLAAVLIGVGVCAADEGIQMPQPQKEHEWLRQLAGEWEFEGECITDPTRPPQKSKGTETGRMVGGFWTVLEIKGEFMGSPFTGILTLGYDPEAKRYVGTWIDSMTSRLWQYQGTLDAKASILTLESEGPCPEQPGKLVRFRETIEVKGKDHKVFTSRVEKDGKWVTMMTLSYRRKS